MGTLPSATDVKPIPTSTAPRTFPERDTPDLGSAICKDPENNYEGSEALDSHGF